MNEAVADNGLAEALDPPQSGVTDGNVARKVLKNSAAQLLGRFAVAFARFVMVAAILRTGGRAMFAQYSIVLGVLSLGEWLVDFGTTDAFTRELCREPAQSGKLLRVLAAIKLAQFPLCLLVTLAMLLGFGYPAVVVRAGMVGAFSLLWFAGVLIYRVAFRSQMRVELDVAAEFLSVLVLVPSTLMVCRYHLGLIAIFWAYFFSRLIFLALCILFSRCSVQAMPHKSDFKDIFWGARSSFAIGVAGFLAVGYETTDVLLLSRLGSLTDVAVYSGAQKLVTPVMMAMAAVASTFYPVFASYWPADRARFQQSCQRALDAVLLLAGLCVAPLIAGSGFFMRLLGPQLADFGIALKGMAMLCFLKTVTITLGPILYIVFAQRQLLKMVTIALLVKIVLVYLFVRHFGYTAVIATSIGLEIAFGFVTVLMIRHFTQWKVRWRDPLKVLAILTAALALTTITRLSGLSASVVAASLYLVLAYAVGLLKLSEVQRMLKRNPTLSAA